MSSSWKRFFPESLGQARKTRQAAQPDFPAIRRQLQTHRNLTLQLLWEEYREGNPEGYSYSRYVAGKNMLRGSLVARAGRRATLATRQHKLERDLANLRHGGSPCIKHHVPVSPPIGSVIPQHLQTNEIAICATVQITARVPPHSSSSATSSCLLADILICVPATASGWKHSCRLRRSGSS